MTTPPLDLPALRDIANAATPGPWATYDAGGPGDDWPIEAGPEAEYLGHSPDDGVRAGFTEPDATHIAAFDPPTVLALIDRAEAAEKKVAAVRELHAHKHYDKYGRSHKEPQGHGAWCTFCGNAPDDCCATIKALDGTL